MPTYRFKCGDCQISWEEAQPADLNTEPVSSCPRCKKECLNTAFGGSGFQFAGRMCNKQLTDFPDYANKINKEAQKDAQEMEKYHDAYIEERLKKEKDDD